MKAPVIVLSGLNTEKQPHRRTRLSELKWWGVALIIIMALGGIMIYVRQMTTGWIESVLLLSAFIFAMVMVWFWNKHR